MLKKLDLHNFKAWKEAKVDFGKITGFFGTNSSGKSSLMQFLLCLKQTKETTDRATVLNFSGPYVELGLFKDVVFKHDETKPISWELAYTSLAPIILATPGKTPGESITITEGDEVAIFSEVCSEKNRPGISLTAKKLTYTLGKASFSLEPKTKEANSYELLSPSFAFKKNAGRPWGMPGPIKSYGFPDQVRAYFQNAGFLTDLELSYEEQMDRIFYLGPLREPPKRDYLWARSSRPTGVGIRGDKAIEAILSMTDARETRQIERNKRKKPFQEVVAHWLKELGVIHAFKVEEIAEGKNRWQVSVQTQGSGTEVLLTDVGFGVSQILPIITLLQYVPEGSTVILEQPEIHLHPLAQANLADIIINATQTRNIQIVFESHSEHLLLRLQRRIAEEKLAHDDVSLYFCATSEGASKLEKLDIDLFGHIRNWPEKFFGDAFGEVLATEKNRLQRHKREKA